MSSWMKYWTSTFQSESARFQVEHGFGVLVKATDVTDMHIGRGIYHELFRDHEWLYISRVSPSSDGQIEIEYLELKTSRDASTEGNSTTAITEERAIKYVLTFERDDQLLISAEPITCPKGRRIKVVTTRIRTEEPLED